MDVPKIISRKMWKRHSKCDNLLHLRLSVASHKKGTVKLPGLLSFSIQIDVSCLSFEGHQFQGKKAIMDKLNVSLSVNPTQQQCRQYFYYYFFTYMFAYPVMLGFCYCLCEFVFLNQIIIFFCLVCNRVFPSQK